MIKVGILGTGFGEHHGKWAIEGLKNNKHIFCETPLSSNVNEGEKIRDISLKNSKNVYVDMFIKFSTPHQMAINLVKKGGLGELCNFRSYNKTSPRWGDLSIKKNIETFHIHNIDFIYELMGMPKNITTTAMDFNKKSIVTSVLNYSNRYAVLESNSNMPYCCPFEIGFEIVFENGVVRYDAVYGEFTREEFSIFEINKPREILSLDMKDDYEEVFKHLLSCMTNNSKSEIIDIEHAISMFACKDINEN